MGNSTNYTTLFAHLRERAPAHPAAHRAVMVNLPFALQHLRHRSRNEIDIVSGLRRNKKSDRIFVFGSGYSLNAMSLEEWSEIERHDTLGFNWFIYQDFVRVDYHVIRETYAYVKTLRDLKAVAAHYGERLCGNQRFDDAVLFIQGGRAASSGNCMLAYGYIPLSRLHARFTTRSRGRYEPPSLCPRKGLVHGPGTLIDSINLAILGGWTEIVLVGVDLYDRRYFWLPYDSGNMGRDPEKGVDIRHNTATNGIVDYIARWNDAVAPRGQRILSYNPDSLLVPRIPVYETTPRSWRRADIGR